MRWIVVAVCSALTTLSCLPLPESPETTAADCSGACSTLERLGCPGAEGSPGPDDQIGTADDLPCAETCVELESKGASMETACVSQARSCFAVERCFGDE